MIPTFLQPLVPAAHDRLTLLLNHVLGAEPDAMARLRPFAGKHLVCHAQDLALRFVVTPAGLLEAVPHEAAARPAELTLRLASSGPLELARRALQGEHPPVEIQGDSAFAEAVGWLVVNLRWDIEDDMARVLGDAPAHELARMARRASDGLRELATRAGRMFDDGRAR